MPEEVEVIENTETEEVVEKPQTEEPSKNSVFVGDMLERIYVHINDAKEDISEEFEKEIKKQVRTKQKEKEYFICTNELWDIWAQKLFAQLISVKIWVMVLITILLSVGLITNVQFASIIGVIMGMKGVFNTAAVWREKTSDKVIDRV